METSETSETLEVKVDYYNNNHKEDLRKYPSFLEIDKMISKNKNVTINKSEFLTYLLFTEQRDVDGLRTFADFSKRIIKSYYLLEHFIEFSKASFRARLIGDQMDANLIERVGVSLSLCLINKIHGLTDADWSLIPVNNFKKTFDFNYASNGNQFIEVESKGSSIENNKIKNTNISNHKKSIEDKKQSISSAYQEKKESFNNLLYGVISVLDKNNIPQIWLLDPDPLSLEKIEPRKFRLLNRLYFYWRNLKYIVPNSTLLHALINRIKIIEELDDYNRVNKLYFLNRNGKQIRFYGSSFARKSVIGNDDVIGVVYPFDDKSLFFTGFPIEIFKILRSQDFDRILKFSYNKTYKACQVKCRIRTKQKGDFKIPDSESFYFKYVDKNREYIEFTLRGDLNTSSSGRVFGILNFDTCMNPSL